MTEEKTTEEKEEAAEVTLKKNEEAKKTDEKHSEKKTKSKPKTEAIMNAYSLPLSPKKAAAVCRAITGMTPEMAIKYLHEVSSMKRAVPMRGEIPHRKGSIMSGRYPKKTAEEFIKLVKGLSANAGVVGISNPIISEAIANKAQMPFGRFGAVRRKRTHVRLIARTKKENIGKMKKQKAESKEEKK